MLPSYGLTVKRVFIFTILDSFFKNLIKPGMNGPGNLIGIHVSHRRVGIAGYDERRKIQYAHVSASSNRASQ